MKTAAILCAAWGAAETIGDMIESFRQQELLDGWRWELLIGVDACPKTAAALSRMGIPFKWAPENVGAYRIRNQLAMDSQADVFGVFDPDDVMLQNYMRTLAPLAFKHGMAAGGKNVEDCGQPAGYRPFGGGQSLFCRDVFEAVGGFQSHRYSGDWDFTVRAGMAGAGVALVNSPLWIYRRSPGCATMAVDTRCGSPLRLGIDAANDLHRMTAGSYVKPVGCDWAEWEGIVKPSDVSVVALVPGDACEYRKRAWEWIKRHYWDGCGWELVEVDCSSGYNKGAAMQAGANVAKGKILVMVDADVLCDWRALRASVEVVAAGDDWSTPNTTVTRLSKDESAAYMAFARVSGAEDKPYRGQVAGGLFVVSRECWKSSGGVDAGFVDWGGEDTAYGYVLERDYKGAVLGGELLHFWHPPQAKCTSRKTIESQSSLALLNKYRIAYESGGEWPKNQYNPAEWEGKFSVTVDKLDI